MNTSTPDNKKRKQRNRSSPSLPLDLTELKKSKLTPNVNMSDGTSMETPEVHEVRDKSDELSDAQLDKLCERVGAVIEAKLDARLKPMVDDLVKRALNDFSDEIKALKSENAELKKKINVLELQADAAEQYSRRNCLRVTGIVESPGESTDTLITDMARALGVDLSLDEIDRSHRVGKIPPIDPAIDPEDAPPPKRAIIVKFVSYRSRNKFFKVRTLAKDRGYKKVFVNEDLTRYRNNLLYQARMLAKDDKLLGAWSSDGTILIKENSNRVLRVNTADDLARY